MEEYDCLFTLITGNNMVYTHVLTVLYAHVTIRMQEISVITKFDQTDFN